MRGKGSRSPSLTRKMVRDEDGRKVAKYEVGTKIEVLHSLSTPIGTKGEIVEVLQNYRQSVMYKVKVNGRYKYMNEVQIEPIAYAPTLINKILRRA